MANFDLMKQLATDKGGKIILLIMDGLGGLPMEPGGKTELEAAFTPNMDRLAQEGCLGGSHPITRGVTPGSGPAHLSLFGYDPVAVPVGRGVLSALGAGIPIKAADVAARGNFCTVDAEGLITDRRAGRISNEAAAPLVEKLRTIQIPGVNIEVRLEQEYRFVLVLSGEGLNGGLADTDPQVTGKAPYPATALVPEAEKTAEIVRQWVDAAAAILKNDSPANMVTLRGFGQPPDLPTFQEVYKLNAACVAVYPMYKGVASLAGMDVLPTGNFTPAQEFQVVADHWHEYDFFFIHIKYTDSRGEDGNFPAKAAVIEQVDTTLPILLGLNPDVLIITGDHSTPAKLRAHSWHPVPTLLWAPATHMPDACQSFGERETHRGGLGQFPANELMPMAMGHALRFNKYGA